MSIYTNIQIKRVYDRPSQSDGIRFLTDRLWPRGLSKESLIFDEWIKDLCPSKELRKEWHSRNINFSEFKSAYRHELSLQREKVERLALIALDTPITLLTSVKFIEESHASILRTYLVEVAEELHSFSESRASNVCYTDLENK